MQTKVDIRLSSKILELNKYLIKVRERKYYCDFNVATRI